MNLDKELIKEAEEILCEMIRRGLDNDMNQLAYQAITNLRKVQKHGKDNTTSRRGHPESSDEDQEKRR